MKRGSRRSFSLRIAFPLLVAILLAAACGDDAEVAATATTTTTTSQPSQPPTPPVEPAATTTTAASTAIPTLTFTGSECVYSGPNTFPLGEIVKFTWRNESSVEMVVEVWELVDVTLEDLAADVAIFPSTEVFPPLAAGEAPDAVISIRVMDPDTEVTINVIFRGGGDYGTICWPIDGNPAVPGVVLTAESPPIPEEVANAAIAVVLSALEAKNSFDLDGWLAAFEGGERNGVPYFAEEILMNANQRWEVVEPCQVTGTTASGETVVECLISNTDDFWGVGGISDTERKRFTVNPDGLITNTFGFASSRRFAFNRAFHGWLSDTYPDVYAEMDRGIISHGAPGFDTQNPEHMLVALDYVQEFVAQSDVYPLDPADT